MRLRAQYAAVQSKGENVLGDVGQLQGKSPGDESIEGRRVPMGDIGGIHSRESWEELRGGGGAYLSPGPKEEIVGRDNSMC